MQDFFLFFFLRIFSWKAIQKVFKNSQKNNVADSIPETLRKHNLNEYVFLRIFQNNFSLKNFSTTSEWSLNYSVKMHLQNMFKTLPKICD